MGSKEAVEKELREKEGAFDGLAKFADDLEKTNEVYFHLSWFIFD